VLHDPPVLILDEPTDGLDPLQKAHLRGVLAEMGRSKAILMSTHILEEAEQLCDRLIVIAAGRIVADAPRAELADGDGRLAPAFARLVAGAAEQVAP
jgi:ABC-2 type transport system ATP-binding protein